MVSAFIKSDDC